MKKADILISSKDGIYLIRVDGRATFESAPPLRNLAKDLEQINFSKICVDLKTCTGMDSTFMGILAMLGLRSKKISAEMDIFNADESNVSLLCGLGLRKLFLFLSGDMDLPAENSQSWSAQETAKEVAGNKVASARTVLDAHKTLMGVDEQNVKKFESVVNFVQKDIDKLEKKD